jgi:hypothetical protein
MWGLLGFVNKYSHPGEMFLVVLEMFPVEKYGFVFS